MLPSVYLLEALSDEAQEWIDENIDCDITFNGGVPIEHRYLEDIINVLTEEGFKNGEDFVIYS